MNYIERNPEFAQALRRERREREKIWQAMFVLVCIVVFVFGMLCALGMALVRWFDAHPEMVVPSVAFGFAVVAVGCLIAVFHNAHALAEDRSYDSQQRVVGGKAAR